MTTNATTAAPAATTNTPPVQNNVGETNKVNTTVTEQPTAAEIRKLKLKIEGQELELPEDEVIKLAQKGKYADKQLQSASQARKQAEELIRLLKTDPMAALQHEALGLDVKKIISDYVNKQATDARLTPEQKELRDLRKMKQEQEENARKSQETAREQEINERAGVIQQEIESEITEVLSTSGLPKTNYTVQRIAHYMKLALTKGYKNVTPKSVLPLVKEDFIRTQNDMYGQADEDTLAEMLGDELLSKVVKAHLKKTQKGNVKPSNKTTSPTVVTNKQDNQPKKGMTRAEYLKYTADKVAGLK